MTPDYCLHCALHPEIARAMQDERLSVNEVLFKLAEIQAELIAGVADRPGRRQLIASVAAELRRMTARKRMERVAAGEPDHAVHRQS